VSPFFVKITLTKFEAWAAITIGAMRNHEAILSNRTARFSERTPGELWGFHIEAAMAEMAVAKYLGIHWGYGVNTFAVSDIEHTIIDVRWSTRSDMKVKKKDTGIIVSVTGICPTYEIKGWMYAKDAQVAEYYHAQPPECYFVPHDKINPIETLKKMHYEH